MDKCDRCRVPLRTTRVVGCRACVAELEEKLAACERRCVVDVYGQAVEQLQAERGDADARLRAIEKAAGRVADRYVVQEPPNGTALGRVLDDLVKAYREEE